MIDWWKEYGYMDNSGNKPENAAEKMERELADRLTSAPLVDEDQERKVRAVISPKYEIRIQTEHDPIVEETKLYRGMAEEVDDRYDSYMKRVRPKEDKGE
jgi:hypothetical protein